MTDFESVVYVAGPKTLWQQKIAEDDVIARKENIPFLFLALMFARRLHGQLDPKKCGYAVLQDGEVLEHVKPEVESPSDAAAAKNVRSSEPRAPGKKSPRRSEVATKPPGRSPVQSNGGDDVATGRAS